MFEIVEAAWLAENVRNLHVLAPRIAKKQQPGQFVIVRVHEHGERIPLTIAGSDPERGTIRLIVQGVGKTTRLLNSLDAGQFILDVVGPLGKPSEIRRYGTVVVVAGGLGAAIAMPTAMALKQAGNHVQAILGARNKELVILEDELRDAAHELFVMTDDGSYGQQGLVTDKLRELIGTVTERPERGSRLSHSPSNEHVDLVLAIGPIPMMRGVAEVTRAAKIPTIVSLNSIMVDGTGMCGGCRVIVGGESRFACVDGPEFDAHQVDFDVLAQRNAMYRETERQALQQFEEHPQQDLCEVDHVCRLAKAHPELAAHQNPAGGES